MPPADATDTAPVPRYTGARIIHAADAEPGPVDRWRWHRFALGIILWAVALGCAAVMLRVALIAWHLRW